MLPPCALPLHCRCIAATAAAAAPCCPPQATQVSPWIVTLEALEPFRCPAVTQEPAVLPYLREADRHTWDVALTAGIVPAGSGVETTVTRTNLKHL